MFVHIIYDIKMNDEGEAVFDGLAGRMRVMCEVDGWTRSRVVGLLVNQGN